MNASRNTPSQASVAAYRASLITLAGLFGYGAYSAYLATQTLAWQPQALTAAVVAGGLLAVAGLVLARWGRVALGMWLTVMGLWAGLIGAGTLLSGLGWVLLLVAPVLTGTLVARALPGRGRWVALAVAAVAGVGLLLLDLLGLGGYRLMVPDMQVVTPTMAVALLVLYGVLLVGVGQDFSLRTKLILGFLTVAIIPLAVLAVLNDRASRALVTETANRALLAGAQQTALTIDTFIDNLKSIIQTEAQHPVVRAYLSLPAEARARSTPERELRQLLLIWQLRDTRVRAYSLLDAAGTVVLSTNSADIGLNYSEAAFFIDTVATGQSHVSDLSFRNRSAEADLYFSMLVRDQSLDPIGMLVARYDAIALRDLVVGTVGLAGPESFGVLIDDRYVQLAHGLDTSSAYEATYKLVDGASQAEIEALQAAGRLSNLAGVDYGLYQADLAAKLAQADTQPYFTANDSLTGDRLNQVAVTTLNTRPWRVAFFQPRDVFLAPVEQQTRATLLLAAVIAVLVAGAAVVGAQVLAEPITRLTRAAEQVAGGDLSVRSQVVTGDETGMLSRTFNIMTERLQEMVGTLEQRVSERTGQLQAAADISRATASVRDLDELMRLALELIRDRFGFYHASIFLMDRDERFAVLRESTGPVGAQLKERGHKLGVGSKSLIGWVTQQRQPRVALDVGEDPFHFKNPLLPETRSELAIPLSTGTRLLGALDVQSTQPNAFGPADLQVLQTVADQLSIAIENALLFEQTEASLKELSDLYERMTRTSWRGLLRGEATQKTYEAAGAPDLDSAAPPLRVPLVLRGQTLGYIDLHGRAPEDWTAEERAALNSAAGQVASALESAALLEETQRRRAQEQIINDVTQLMRASLNPTVVVQSGLRELGKALGATEVVVRLTPGGAPAQTNGGEAKP